MMKEGCLKEHVPSLLMKVLYCARICRPDLSWTIGTLSRRISKWTRHDDLQLAHLFSYIKTTSSLELQATASCA
eukprot:4333994-Amphidinium_carterae.1